MTQYKSGQKKAQFRWPCHKRKVFRLYVDFRQNSGVSCLTCWCTLTALPTYMFVVVLHVGWLQFHTISYTRMFSYFRSSEEQHPPSTKNKESKANDQFDGLNVSSDKLNHPTANRAKPPQRRPPTGLGTASNV